jgi:hypothetical protein
MGSKGATVVKILRNANPSVGVLTKSSRGSSWRSLGVSWTRSFFPRTGFRKDFWGGDKSTFAFCKSPPHPCLGPTAFRFNDYDHGAAVFHHACKMGLEGIVSKRKGEAVRREAEEDWGR